MDTIKKASQAKEKGNELFKAGKISQCVPSTFGTRVGFSDACANRSNFTPKQRVLTQQTLCTQPTPALRNMRKENILIA